MLHKILLALLALLPLVAWAQSPLLPYDPDYYHLISRYEIKHGLSVGVGMKPMLRQHIAQLADTLALLSSYKVDAFNAAYLQQDNWEWSNMGEKASKKPFLKHFYQTPSDGFHVKESRFSLHVNPFVTASIGRDNNLSGPAFLGARGISARGQIGKKLGFYTMMSDNQVRFPKYVMGFGTPLSNIPSADKEGALPQAGFWKLYKDGVVDFFRAWGHVSLELMPEINVQIGHGQQFLGHGHRSLFLSDMAPAYFFVRFNTKVWKLRYTNLYANIAPFALKDSDRFTEKYFAMHHLALDVTPNFQVGLFENVLFSRGDSTKQFGFDPGYLNPIIFFRAVEHNKASLDNVMLGIDFRWNVAKRWQFYGQMALDEFKTSEILNAQGSYINKFAAQAGMKWIDLAGIKNLDLQLEGNLARPFTYTHSNRNIVGTQTEGNYQHFGQPLAHPWGANFIEAIAILRYQPMPRVQLTGKMLYGKIGEDAAGQNMGGNIMKPYDTATQLTGNKILQGVRATNTFADFTISWQPKHGFFIDLKQIVRRFDSQDDTRDNNTVFTSIAVRWNMAQWTNEF